MYTREVPNTSNTQAEAWPQKAVAAAKIAASRKMAPAA